MEILNANWGQGGVLLGHLPALEVFTMELPSKSVFPEVIWKSITSRHVLGSTIFVVFHKKGSNNFPLFLKRCHMLHLHQSYSFPH